MVPSDPPLQDTGVELMAPILSAPGPVMVLLATADSQFSLLVKTKEYSPAIKSGTVNDPDD
jgi:hypothetical protein